MGGSAVTVSQCKSVQVKLRNHGSLRKRRSDRPRWNKEWERQTTTTVAIAWPQQTRLTVVF